MRVAVSSTPSDSLARVFSTIGLPPVLALPTAFLAGLRAIGYPDVATSVATVLLAGCILPTALTVVLFRTGRARTLDLRDRADRALPSAATALGCILAWAWLWHAAAPRPIVDLALGVALQMAVLATLTLRWKVSYHAASASALAVVSRSLGISGLTLALMALAICIGWSRLYLRRHTLAQVAVGALTAAPIALLS